MFPGCLQDFSRMFSGCSDGSYWPGGFWWSFQMKVWTLMIQRNSMIQNYLMIPAIQWSPAIWWSSAIWWSIGSMDFDNQKVYGDTSITDGLVWFTRIDNVQYPFLRLQTSPLVSASNVVTLLLKCRSLPSLSTTAAWSCDSEWSWNWDVQGVNFATLVVRTLATVVQKEADMYLPTNLVPLHLIIFEPGV